MFYNMENFFDTIDDPNQRRRVPSRRCEAVEYGQVRQETPHMERVLFDIAAIDRNYPAVIGVSEIENRSILEDIASTRKLLPARYAICHYDSPDLRGVDVAFLYRPDVFKTRRQRRHPRADRLAAQLAHARHRDDVGNDRRRALPLHGRALALALGGQAASAFKRNAAADQMRAIADSVLKVNPATKIVAMGDFNDDPTDESVEVHLGAKAKIKELQPGDFYTPFADMLKAGLGTLAYRDAWNLFDNIVVSENLATGSAGKLKLVKDPYKKTNSTAISSNPPTSSSRRGSIRVIRCVPS